MTVGQNTEWHRLGAQIGWLDGNDLYLEPDSAYAVAQRLARDQGHSLPVNKNTMWKRLKEKGLLASFKEGKNLTRVSIGSKRRYAIHVLADTLDDIPSISGPRGPVGPTPSVNEGFSPSDSAPKPDRVENRGQKPGPEEFRLTADLPDLSRAVRGHDPLAVFLFTSPSQQHQELVFPPAEGPLQFCGNFLSGGSTIQTTITDHDQYAELVQISE